MKKMGFLLIALILVMMGTCLAQGENLLIDDFEVAVTNGPEGTVDFGSGNGATVSVTTGTEIKNTGNQVVEAPDKMPEKKGGKVKKGKDLRSK